MAPNSTSTNPHRTPSAGPAASKTPDGKRVEDEELKPYILAGELGKGSFAVVYKGYHEQTHEQVAIKTVSRSILTQKLFENLQSEIDILKSLSHRHITKLLDIVKAERNIYLIMEYCSGGDLTAYIKKRGRIESLEYVPSPGAAPIYYPHPRTGGLDEIAVRSFLRQLARALKFLRQRNLIHRDIKPQNLLLKPASPEELARGHPLGIPILKVADFGFARSLPNAMMAETLCGSPLYMAPEILRYEKYDAKADLWSVGAVLYETAVGKPPFRAQNHIELLKKIEHSKGIKFPDEDPAFLEKEPEVTPVPGDIKKLIRSLLKRFPAERSSFDEFFSSTALAKSKFPRPPPASIASANSLGSASGSTEVDGRGISRKDGDGELVVVGTMRKRPKDLAMLDLQPTPSDIAQPITVVAPSPEETKSAPPLAVAPSKITFRRRDALSDGGPQGVQDVGNSKQHIQHASAPPAAEFPPVPGPSKPPAPPRALSTEASIIPGETEEDGMLRREYVMVGDTRAIEFNRAVDEISAERRRPLRTRKSLSSPTFEKRQTDIVYPPDENASPSPIPTSGTNAFPPPPHSAMASPLSSSPSRGSALTRALNLASKKLFGAPRYYTASPGGNNNSGSNGSSYSNNHYHGGERDSSRSPRRAPLILGKTNNDAEGEKDPLEEEMLVELEELAQKTDVLTRWADEMYEYVKAVPQKPLPEPAKFTRRQGESDKHAERRKNADIEAEYNAVTCVALYMLLMAFSQKGIDRLRVHHEGVKMRDPDGVLVVSDGFDEALSWFKEHFIKCNDRAALVKTWLPEKCTTGQTWLDQLVYDRALQLSRKAARMELLDQASGPECEVLYEESLWYLYALQDDVMQAGNPFRDEDRTTIASWVARTKSRLVRCRARRAMSEGERLQDVKADENLNELREAPGLGPKPSPPR
ncbi:kinase-like protein [Rickenella mellea]|uniref:non-specific serine/threonine protein kinase n=1 Tax=Rickenella mellea TaxID=50990 RepID=A0A4Y7QKZ6_9AGAM|nr:kinase-like protein [Rickenella mellea]